MKFFLLIMVYFFRMQTPNGRRVSRAQGLLANCDDDHAKYLSQKVRVSASAARAG